MSRPGGMAAHAPPGPTPGFLPGLWPEPLPALPRTLEGYARDDAVWLHEGPRRSAARIIAVLRGHHLLTLRTADHRIVQVNPITHPHHISRRPTL